MINRDQYYTENGEFHCKYCSWWVPEGMKYLAEEHECKGDGRIDKEEVLEHARKQLDEPDEQLLKYLQGDIEAYIKYTEGTDTEDAKLYIEKLISEEYKS